MLTCQAATWQNMLAMLELTIKVLLHIYYTTKMVNRN